MLYINNIALPEDQQSVFVNNIAAEKVYYNNELIWEYAPYPTCPGYTLYGDYFLSDTITAGIDWREACAITETVTVTKGSKTITVTARTLSRADLETLTTEQRKIGVPYWTSTIGNNGAWIVSSSGVLYDNSGLGKLVNGCARLGFESPFI